MASWPVTKPSQPAEVELSPKAQKLAAELALLQAEEAFAAQQEAGQARRDVEVEQAFKAAKNVTEFQEAFIQIDPAVPMEDKLALRALREDYRLNVRQPKKNAAAPGPVVASATVKEPN